MFHPPACPLATPILSPREPRTTHSRQGRPGSPGHLKHAVAEGCLHRHCFPIFTRSSILHACLLSPLLSCHQLSRSYYATEADIPILCRLHREEYEDSELYRTFYPNIMPVDAEAAQAKVYQRALDSPTESLIVRKINDNVAGYALWGFMEAAASQHRTWREPERIAYREKDQRYCRR